MARVPKLSSEARSRLQKHRRDLQRKSASEAVKRLESARREMEKDENLVTVVAAATNENAFFNTVLSMVKAVQSSWNLDLPITLTNHYDTGIVAFTDFKKIEIRYPYSMVPRATVGGFNPLHLRTAIADIKGISYHEIGHNLFTTPFPVLVDMAVDDGVIIPTDTTTGALKDFWNVLEDQRMEAALIRESPIMVDYLTTMVLNHIVARAAYGTLSQWPLLTGRRYIPAPIRIEMKKEFASAFGEDLERRGTNIVRSYMSATSAGQMLSAVIDFYRYFRDIGLSVPPPVDRHPAVDDSHYSENKEQHKERINSSADTSEEDEDQSPSNPEQPSQSQPTPSNDSDDKDTDDNDSSDEDGNDSDDSGDDSSPRSTDDSGSNPDPTDSQQSSQTPPSSPSQDGNSKKSDVSNDENSDGVSRDANEDIESFLRRMAEEANEKRLQDASLDSTVRDVYTNTADELPLHKSRTTTDMSDSKMAGEALTLAQRLEESLHTYLAETAPIWQHRQTRGFIDPFAYRTKMGGSQEYRRLYDNGDIGNDMAVTVMLDVSGSMYGQEEELGASAYATKAACMALDIPCTITTFSHVSEIIWTAKDHPELIAVKCGGGTDPTGVCDVLDYFEYDKGTHLVVVMTDGMFDNSFKGFNHYKTGNRYFLGLGFGSSFVVDSLNNAHADEAHPITNLMDIPQVVSNFIAARVH